MTPNARGAALALIAFTLFAAHDVIVKMLGGTYSPVQIVFFSVLFSFPLTTLMLMRDPAPGTLRPVHPWWILARCVSVVITGFAIFYAFSTLPLAQVYAIIFASPLLITILAIPILGEKVRVRRGLAVLVGLSGVLLVIRPGQTELGLGHLFALIGAFGGAFNSVILRKIGQEERAVVQLLYPMMANFLVMGGALTFVYVPMPFEHIAFFAAMAVLAWAAGRSIIGAYTVGEAMVVAPMQYSQIIWASLYGVLFFDETIDRMTAIGAGIIIASGIYIVLREDRTDASENRPVLRTRTRPDTGTSFRISPLLPKSLRFERRK